MKLNIKDDEWIENGSEEDPRSRLIAPDGSLHINGIPMHVEAYALKPQNEQVFADHEFAEVDTAYFTITGTSVMTFTVKERNYALLVTPHGT